MRSLHTLGLFFFLSLLTYEVTGVSFSKFQVPEFIAINSASLRSTGKRSEFGEPIHFLELTLPSSRERLTLRVKAIGSIESHGCLWTKRIGNDIIEEFPCPKIETFEGVYEDEQVFLGYLDEERTIMKGFFHHAGERFFIDPTFEHLQHLKMAKMDHLAKGSMMIIYPESEINQTRSNQLITRKRGITGPATGTIKYSSPPFPSGDCTLRKTANVKIFLDHSFINRWNSDQSTFSDTFTPQSGTSWSTRLAFLQIYLGAVSKYVYEPSTGIKLVLTGVEEHPNPNDAPWNAAGTVVDGRYKCPNDINAILNKFSDWCKADGSPCIPVNSGGLNHLMTDCQRLYPGQSGTIGLAWIGIICSNLNTATCTHLPGRDGYQCTAHELGHNFGAQHDFRDGNTDIMSYAPQKYDGFSDQSYNAICKHLSAQGYRCLTDNNNSPSSPPSAPSCSPNCAGKSCGDNGCGGSCGSCKIAQRCNSGKCAFSFLPCIPLCMGKECGDNGCGGSCGSCQGGSTCNTDMRKCAASPSCMPSCVNKGCGMNDGCGGVCGSGCNLLQRLTGMTCDAGTSFQCGRKSKRGEEVSISSSSSSPTSCTPNCNNKTCGDDGCGGSCGRCGRSATCNTQTYQCECVPQTSCEAQNKTCGFVYNGCYNSSCGSPCTTQCTPNPSACAGKTCGFVSDGCDVISCGACQSSLDGMTCVNHQCVKSDECGACAAEATCTNGKCICRPGFVGNGFICDAQVPLNPFTPEAWTVQSGDLTHWSLSNDNKVFTNLLPSKDVATPSLIRWTNSKAVMAATDISLEVNVQTRSAQAMGGIAFGLDGDNYITVVLSNNQVLMHSGSISSRSSGAWYSLGSYAAGSFVQQWVGLSLFIRQHDSFTVSLKGKANGMPFPADCGTECVGINITSMFASSSSWSSSLSSTGAGDVGLFGLVDVSDFSGLRINAKTKTYVNVGRCLSDVVLRQMLSNAMGLDESMIKELSNPCTSTNNQKRSVEQTTTPLTVSFTTVGVSEISPSAIGPSIMSASLEVGGPLASSAASVSITSVAPVSAAVIPATIVTAAVVAESTVVASAAAGGAVLSSAAIAGVVVASAFGVAIAAASVMVVKNMKKDDQTGGGGEKYDKFDDVPLTPANPLNIDTPSPPPAPAPAPSPAPSSAPKVPKGGKDILLTHTDDLHTSITGRGVPTVSKSKTLRD